MARAWVPKRPESSAERTMALQAPQISHEPSPGLALKEVRGFAPGRELQQVVCNGGRVLAEGRACGRARSWGARRGLGPTDRGLEVGGACRGRCVAGPQRPVCVLAGCPAHEALQGWGHGWVQAFGGEAATEGGDQERWIRPDGALPAIGPSQLHRKTHGRLMVTLG